MYIFAYCLLPCAGIFAAIKNIVAMKYTHTSVPFSPRAITAGGQTSACVNLRAITLDGENTMTMAEAVSSLYDYPLIPLAHFPDSLCYLFRSKPDEQGTVQLFVFITGEALVYIGKVDGVPSCTVADGENLVLMLPDGPQTISRSGSVFTITGPKPEIPPISVTAVSKGTLTARTSPVTASLAISGQSALLAPDSLERLRTYLFSAYSALSLEANTGGLWIQPVAVRYRVLDSGGNELWRSPVSIVSLDGWQCISGIQAALSPDNGSYSVPALGLAAKAFALQVSVSPPDGSDPWYKRAATVVVEASPQVHPLLPDRAPVARISAATSSSPKLTVWLPGVSPERDANVIMHSRLLQSIAFQPDTVMMRVGRIDLSKGEQTVQFTPAVIAGTAAEISSLRQAVDADAALMEKNLKNDSPLAALLASGQRFSAGCAVQNGDTTVWGDITPVRDNTFSLPLSTAASVPDEAWSAAVSINLGTASYVTRFSAAGGKPLSLAPFLYVPLPQAVSLDICVRSQSTGAITEATVPLSPSDNGLFAWYASPDMKPVPLSVSSKTSLPAVTAYPGGSSRMPGALLVSRSSEPLRPVCGAICSQGQITALTPTVKSLSSWDFSRCHLYAFASDGIYSVSANIRAPAISSSRIDPRRVESRRAVAYTPRGVVAIAGGQLVSCTASSVKELWRPPESVSGRWSEVVWNSGQDEVLLSDTAGNVLAMSLSDGQMHHLLVPERIEHLGAAGSNVWLTGTDSTFALGTPGDAVRQHIEWCGSVFLPVAVRPVQLTVPVAASHFDGTVELRADNGAGTAHSLLVAKLEINGEINAPLRLRVVSPPRSRLTLRIVGRASADFLLRTAYVGAISTRSLR